MDAVIVLHATHKERVMAKCPYCDHDENVCANTNPVTENYIKRIHGRRADNAASDPESKELYKAIKANLIIRKEETLKTLLDIVNSDSDVVALVLDAISWFDGYGKDYINNSTWIKEIVTYGLYNKSSDVRDHAMHLVEIWPTECIDVLRNHIEKSNYLIEYQKEIVESYDRLEYEHIY